MKKINEIWWEVKSKETVSQQSNTSTNTSEKVDTSKNEIQSEEKKSEKNVDKLLLFRLNLP